MCMYKMHPTSTKIKTAKIYAYSHNMWEFWVWHEPQQWDITPQKRVSGGAPGQEEETTGSPKNPEVRFLMEGL